MRLIIRQTQTYSKATWNHTKTMMSVFESFFPLHFVFRTIICHQLYLNKTKLRFLNFEWSLNMGKDNKKLSLGCPKGGLGRLIEVASKKFYLTQFY